MDIENAEMFEILAFVKISKNRAKVLKSLRDEIKFPSQIAKDTNLRINQVSSLLKGLKEKNLVECLNENSKVGRFYRVTTKGKKILKYLE